MIFFLVTHFIILLKLILIILLRLIVFENTFSKMCFILVLLFTANILYKYPRTRFQKLSSLRQYRLNLINKFRISGFWNEIYNGFLILFYFFGITSFLFYFRLLNKEKIIDLKYYYLIISNFLIKSTFLNTLYTILVCILLLILYMILMIRIIKYLKFQVIRRHLYFMNFETKFWYQSTLFYGFIYKIVLIGPFSIESRIYKFIELAYKFLFDLFKIKKNYGPDYDKESYEKQTELCLKNPVDPDYILIKYRFIYKFIPFVLKHIHHFLLLLLIIYDLTCNNFVITKIFYIFPYIFFYDLYARISIFVDDLHLPYDQSFHDFVYATEIEVIDKDNIIINGDIRDYNHFKHLYHTYVKRNFVKNRNDLLF